MSKTVDFYYDYGSPTAYMAWTQLTKICTKAGATLNYKPMLLGGVFKAIDNPSPMLVESKRAYLQKDFIRHAEHYGIPYVMNPHFPVNTVGIMRGAMWAAATEHLEQYNKVMFEAMWVDQKNMADLEVITEVLEKAGFIAAPIIEATAQAEIKKALIDATNEAVERGVFGAPTMFVGDEMFFGQDRLDWVERALND
ncbi:2-hydroxychromene-2-carboxylate isomerase [Trichlorobacter lovleyi]|jgi:2-hydroxychromene-2-carboxylate isomerase|uniref:2-hydroxychromene-2-carboxylate isomerase n=1 Tax=Trichlorobacter lovleyi (strain ATCC BAA-1151 / DSM 17278 / SZ) TaxID=398767 RepID=B3EBX7_TRIL1|nr:2-hydroxychromene-2-carboxylate isomerase [Trichlorobacter lovleyi]ACD97409.1 DSBA oxidoreductase [Trichlorobacter lovleyi SZ]